MQPLNWITLPAILGALAGMIGTLAVKITHDKYQDRLQAKNNAKKWYQDALGLIARVQQVGIQTTTTYQQQVDYRKLQEKLEPLAEEIQEKAGSAPNRVDEKARAEMMQLAGFCTGILNLTDMESDLTPAEFFRNVQTYAQQNYDGEYDIEDVNLLLNSYDAYELIDDLPDDVEINEEKLDEFASHFSDESLDAGQPRTIDEALHMPLDGIEEMFDEERPMQELLGDSLADYIRLVLTDYTEGISEGMEKRKRAAS